MNKKLLATALGASGAAVIGAVILWPSSSMTVRGGYLDCTATLATGDQVTVEDSSHTVIGSTTLRDTGKGSSIATPLLGWFGGPDSYTQELFKFTVTVPSESRYGISVGSGSHGETWFTPAEMAKGPGITLGC